MIWALGHDVIGNNQPLLETVGRTMDIVTDTCPSSMEIPKSFVLLNNYPNPFNASTVIPFYVPNEERIKLEIFNVVGERISILVNDVKSVGWHHAHFYSEGMPSGVYFYRLSASAFSKTGKMILIK